MIKLYAKLNSTNIIGMFKNVINWNKMDNLKKMKAYIMNVKLIIKNLNRQEEIQKQYKQELPITLSIKMVENMPIIIWINGRKITKLLFMKMTMKKSSNYFKSAKNQKKLSMMLLVRVTALEG